MERIKPSDLEGADFKRALRGYDIIEVHKLLQKAAQEIATLQYEIRHLKAENEKLGPLKQQADTLTKVILTAQNTAQESRIQAERDAESIIAAARRDAGNILAHAQARCEELEQEQQARLEDLRWQIDRAAIEKDKIVETYKSFLQEQLSSIHNSSRRFLSLAVVESRSESVHAAVGFEENEVELVRD